MLVQTIHAQFINHCFCFDYMQLQLEVILKMFFQDILISEQILFWDSDL